MNSTVFAINFLRGHLMPLRFRRILVYGALAYLLVHFFFLLFLIQSAFSSRAEWQKLQSGLGKDFSSSRELNTLREEMNLMHVQAVKELSEWNRLIAIQKEQFPFGGRLAALTRTIPTRTWITGISGDREARRMTVQACYLVNPASPYEHPTKKWVESLKTDPSFSHRLKRLDLGTSSQKMQGKVELFTFELVSEWER